MILTSLQKRLQMMLTFMLLAFQPLTIGGQAVVEGVMMRSKEHISIAVRTPKEKIMMKRMKFQSIVSRNKLLGLPFIRGIIILFETIVLGTKIISWSTNQQTEKEEQLTTAELTISLIVAAALGIGIFKLLPFFMGTLVANSFGQGNTIALVAELVIKLGIFVLYIYLISKMKDIHRMFQYHGAEHKSVNCYEDNGRLAPKNVKKYTMLQARCGTTFIFFVLFMSIFFYAFIPAGWGFWSKMVARVILLPLIGGVCYEVIRLGPKLQCKTWFKAIISPGLLMQKLTTKEPDLKMIEVGIAALVDVLKKEKAKYRI